MNESSDALGGLDSELTDLGAEKEKFRDGAAVVSWTLEEDTEEDWDAGLISCDWEKWGGGEGGWQGGNKPLWHTGSSSYTTPDIFLFV